MAKERAVVCVSKSEVTYEQKRLYAGRWLRFCTEQGFPNPLYSREGYGTLMMTADIPVGMPITKALSIFKGFERGRTCYAPVVYYQDGEKITRYVLNRRKEVFPL